VDNASTHPASAYSLTDFRKEIDGECSVDAIEYMNSDGDLVSVPCFSTEGPHRGKSKGLFVLAKDLHVSIGPGMKLVDIRARLSSHAAFQNTSRIEALAQNYDVKIIFIPKYHCELNAIEGLPFDVKTYVRKMTDQTFPTML
jgi:hypothetical protein